MGRKVSMFYSKLGKWAEGVDGKTAASAIDDGNGITFNFKHSKQSFRLNYGDAGDLIILLRELNRLTDKHRCAIITAKRIEIKKRKKNATR